MSHTQLVGVPHALWGWCGQTPARGSAAFTRERAGWLVHTTAQLLMQERGGVRGGYLIQEPKNLRRLVRRDAPLFALAQTTALTTASCPWAEPEPRVGA